MGSWLPGVVVALIVGLPATLAAVLTWQSSTKARKEAAAKATKDEVREAFETARKLWEGSVAEAERRIEGCTKRIVSLEADIEAARVREKGLRARVVRLEDELRLAGRPIPNGSADVV